MFWQVLGPTLRVLRSGSVLSMLLASHVKIWGPVTRFPTFLLLIDQEAEFSILSTWVMNI